MLIFPWGLLQRLVADETPWQCHHPTIASAGWLLWALASSQTCCHQILPRTKAAKSRVLPELDGAWIILHLIYSGNFVICKNLKNNVQSVTTIAPPTALPHHIQKIALREHTSWEQITVQFILYHWDCYGISTGCPWAWLEASRTGLQCACGRWKQVSEE